MPPQRSRRRSRGEKQRSHSSDAHTNRQENDSRPIADRLSAFGKRTPLTHGHFAEFEKCFGKKSDGTSKRTDQGNEGRFRKFTREYITERDDNLDISWLKDRDASSGADLSEPDVIAHKSASD